MVNAIQKIIINTLFLLGICISTSAIANPLKQCSSAPLTVSKKKIGQATYFAENCQKAWDDQSIQLNFAYDQDIPEWAFKRAATYFLKKNITQYQDSSVLNKITQLYKPVKKGDLYSLMYNHSAKKLTLILNKKELGHIQDHQANEYFKIWLGKQPFSDNLKQQLLN